jgi:hypothetical protein
MNLLKALAAVSSMTLFSRILFCAHHHRSRSAPDLTDAFFVASEINLVAPVRRGRVLASLRAILVRTAVAMTPPRPWSTTGTVPRWRWSRSPCWA